MRRFFQKRDCRDFDKLNHRWKAMEDKLRQNKNKEKPRYHYDSGAKSFFWMLMLNLKLANHLFELLR